MPTGSSSTRASIALAIVILPLAIGGCPSTGAIAKVARPVPSYEPKGDEKCGVLKSHAEPLIIEWPSTARAKLEAVARKGLVAVRYEGCEMEVLAHCKVPGVYGYTAITRKEDRVSMRDADELYANVPLGAAELEAKLAKSGELNVVMTVVGRYEADRATFRKDELSGECTRASHVITAMAAGAFDFFAGAGASVEGNAQVMGAGAGGKSTSKIELLNRDGDIASCIKATAADKAPPEGCGALLRLEVVAVGAAATKKEDAPACNEKTTWDGKQCAALVVVSSVECPSGMFMQGDKCAPMKSPAPSTSAQAPPPSKLCKFGDLADCTTKCETHSDAASCNDLALMYARGEGVALDDKRATALYLRACELGSFVGCNNAGMRLEYGKGAPKDEPKAAASYQRACDGAWAPACNNLGRMYANGDGVLRDELHAVDLFGKGCGLGDPGSCSNLGWFYVRGRGVAVDRQTGVGYLRKGCMGGNGWACDRLKELKETP